jgi:hypothetical protein
VSAGTAGDTRDTGAIAGSQARSAGPPRGYSRVATRSYELVAADAVLADVQGLLREHETLYQWAAHLPQAQLLRGRAPVYVGTLPRGNATVAVRHVWHGGLLAPLTRDRFRMPTRAGTELQNSQRLRELGVDTSEILAYVLYPAGPGLRRIDVASRFMPDTIDFGTVLTGAAPALNRASTLTAIRELLVALASHRALHPDLNVKNILLRRDAIERTATGHVSAIVIDVDVVHFEPQRDPHDVMSANLSRFVRSIRKWRTHFGVDIGDDVIAGFEQECRASIP